MSTIFNLNHLELKAMRQALGLTVAEASSISSIDVSKRYFNYLESGEREIKEDIAETFYELSIQYHLVLTSLKRDIQEHCKEKKPVLPFFHSFELFVSKTGNQKKHFWKIYQAVIGHLLLEGTLTTLDDEKTIPVEFSLWHWLKGNYPSKIISYEQIIEKIDFKGNLHLDD